MHSAGFAVDCTITPAGEFTALKPIVYNDPRIEMIAQFIGGLQYSVVNF
jgi:hypothetical protein